MRVKPYRFFSRRVWASILGGDGDFERYGNGLRIAARCFSLKQTCIVRKNTVKHTQKYE